MGEFFNGFAPFIAAIMALSAFSSLLSLFGLYPPTSDMNIVAGMGAFGVYSDNALQNEMPCRALSQEFAQPALLTPL